MENTNTMLRGTRILAMNTNETSVSEMLHLLGVKPTSDLVLTAIAKFGDTFDMSSLHDFLVEQGIMVKNDVADLRSTPMAAE